MSHEWAHAVNSRSYSMGWPVTVLAQLCHMSGPRASEAYIYSIGMP
jgi:hypothetical protein